MSNNKSSSGKKNIFAENNMLSHLIAGGLAGAVTKTSIAPLERTKIILQLQGMHRQSGDPIKYRGILGTIRTVIYEEGLRALYKGNGANVMRIIPTYALKFAFNDHFKNIVRGSNKNALLTTGQMITVGTLAGLFQITMTYPLEVVRTRLSLAEGFSNSKVKYNQGIIDCAKKIVKIEGPSALYKGIVASWCSGAPYVGLQMTFYDLGKRMLPKKENGTTNILYSMLAGALAGLFAQTATFPGDTIRRRMQTNGMGGEKPLYSGTWDCTKKIYQKEGMVGFYRGLSTNMVRCLPGAAIQFYMYDKIKHLMNI